jgi:hypothetical protein
LFALLRLVARDLRAGPSLVTVHLLRESNGGEEPFGQRGRAASI